MKSSENSNDQQLALKLPVANAVSRDDLIAGSTNALAVELIDAWPDWPGLLAVLVGPIGSGKSHLGSVWAGNADGRVVTMEKLRDLGDDRANARPLLIEDADAGDIDEMELFHVLNAKRSANATILITSRARPSEWGITLADLNSRLRAAQFVEIGEPDDSLLRQVLFKLFADRQLQIDASVIEYLVKRMERSLEAANRIVEQLDTLALARRRKISRQMAREIITQNEIIDQNTEGSNNG